MNLIFAVRSQINVYLWHGVVTGRELDGNFCDAGDIPVLDLGTGYTRQFAVANSSSYTSSFLYIRYTST